MPEEQSGDKRIIQDPQTGKKYRVPASASDEDIRLYLEQKRIRGGAGMGRAAEPAPAVVTPSPEMPDFSQQAQGQPELQQQLPNAMPAQQEQPAPSGLVARRQVQVPANTSGPVDYSSNAPVYDLASKDKAIYDLVQSHRFEYWRNERMRAERMAKQASIPPSERTWLQEKMYTAKTGELVEPYDPELAKGLMAQAAAYSDNNWLKRFGSGSPEQLAEMYSDIERAYRTRGQELPPAWGAAIARFTEGFAGFGKGIAEFFSPPPENVDTSGPIIPWAEERLSRPDTGTGAKIAGMVSQGIGGTLPSLAIGSAAGALAGGLFAAKASTAAAAGNLAKAASLAKSARIWQNVVTLGTQVGVNALAAEEGQRLGTAGWGAVAMMAALPAYSWLTKLPIKYDLVKYPVAGFGSNIAGEAPHIVIDLISGKPLGPDALEQLTAAGLTGAVFGINDIGPAKRQRAYDAAAKLAALGEQEMLSQQNKAAQEEQNARARQLLGERKSEGARATSAEEFANRIEERERFRRAQELKQERLATGEAAEQADWKEAADYRIQQEEAARSAQADETRQQLLDEDTQNVLADMAENAGADRNKFLREMSGELTSRAQVTGKPGTQPLSAGEAARRRIAKRAKDRGTTLGSGVDLFDAARELVDYGIIAGEKLIDAVDTLIVHGGRVGARVGEQIRGYLARNNGDTRGIPNILESLTDYEKSELTDALESSRLDVEESMASESVPAAPGGAEVVPSEGGLGRANVITGKREGLPAPGELPPPLPPTESGWFRPESAADRARARINERMKNIGGVRSSMGVLEAIEGARNLIDGTIIASDKIASVISALRKYGGSWGQKLSTRISEALSRGATAEEIPSIVSSGFHPTVLQDLSVKMLEARAEAERMSVDQPSVSIRQGRGQPARVGESARAKDYMALTVQQEPYRAVIESSFNDAITVYEEMGLKTHQVKELARLEATVAEYEAYLADVESGKVVPNTAIEQTRLKRIQRELPTLREKIDRKVGVYKAAAIKPSSSLAEPIEAETGSSQQEPSQQTGLRWDKERSKVRRPSEYNSGVTEDTLFADLDLNVRPDDYLYDTEAIQWLEDGKWYVGRVIGDGLADGMIEVSYRGRDRVINIISKERSGYVDKIERLGHWDKNPSPEIEDTSIPKQGLRLLEKKEAPKAAAPIQVDDSASKIADVLDERRRVGEEALAKWRSRRASSSTEEFRASPSRVFEKMMVAPEAITAEETSYVAQMLRDAGVNDKIVSQFESGQLARLLKIMDKKQKASVRDLFNKAEAQHLMGSTPEQAPSVSGRQQAGAEFGGETGGETYSTRGGGLGRESVDIASKTPGSVEYAKAAGQIAGEQARFSAESSGVYSPEQIDAISKYESARAALNGLSKTPPKDAAAWTQVKAKAQNDIVTYKSKLPADYKPIQIGGEGEGGLGRSPSTGGTTLYSGLPFDLIVKELKKGTRSVGRALKKIKFRYIEDIPSEVDSLESLPSAVRDEYRTKAASGIQKRHLEWSIKHGLPVNEKAVIVNDIAIPMDYEKKLVYVRDHGWIEVLAKSKNPEPAAPSTPEFKAEFGDSKVVNPDGTPRRVYHGTVSDLFPEFQPKSRVEAYSPDGKLTVSTVDGDSKNPATNGFFFTPSKMIANEYASGQNTKSGRRVIPAYLRIENPFRPTAREVIKMMGPVWVKGNPAGAWNVMIDYAKSKGHDGIIIDEPAVGQDPRMFAGHHIVFDNSQIIPAYAEPSSKKRTGIGSGASGPFLYSGIIPPIPPEVARAAKNAAITIGRGIAGIPETFMKLTRRAAKSAKGSPAALEFVNRGDIAADETRRLVNGEFRPELTEVLNSTGSLELPTAQRLVGTERVRAADELSAATRAPGKNYSPMPAWVNAVESGAKGLPAPQQRIVDSMIALLQKTWDTARNAGALRYNAAKDIYEPLPAHTGPGSVVPRMPTADWLQILQSTADIPDPIVDAFADLNPGMSRTDVLDALNEARAAMGAPNIGGKRAKQSAFEFFRNFGDVPASVTVNGVDIPLFETNIAKYAKTRAQNAAARLGVMKAGLDDISYDPTTMKPSPNPSQREILREDFKLSGGNPDTFDEALSAIEGREIEQASESPGAKVARTFLSFINGPIKASKLSASPLYNPVEPLGGSREQASTASMAQAYAEGIASGVHRMMGGASPFDQQRAAMESLESRGAVPIEKSGTQKFVSGVAARAMELATKRMQDRAGNPDAGGVASDTIRLRQMGYDMDTARRLASGGGTADEYQMLIRKAAAQTTGAGLGGGELTRLDYGRFFRAAFPIRRYGIQQLQQITRTARLAVDALRPNMTGAERAAAGKQILTTAAFRATQGIAQNIMWSALMGGSAGLEAAWSDLKDDPVGAALRGLAASVFSGNMAGVAQQMMKEDGNFFKAIYPVAIAMEAKDFFTNGGRYKDLEWSDHIWEGMQWLVPALRAANGSAHLVGSALGMDTAAFDIKQSRAAYRSWARRNNIPDIRVQTINAPENVERYTDAMKKFRMAVEDQDSDDKLVEILREAFDVKGNESIASTINNYRILREPSKEAVKKGIVTSGLTKEQKDSLRSNIGEQNYKRLESEDKLLEELANAFESGKRFNESRIRRALNKGGMGRAR